MEHKQYFEAVPVSELPETKGWYNLTSNASPAACGRAFFDGNKFKLTSSSATNGLIESGNNLYYLRPVNLSDLIKEEAGKIELLKKRIRQLESQLTITDFNAGL